MPGSIIQSSSFLQETFRNSVPVFYMLPDIANKESFCDHRAIDPLAAAWPDHPSWLLNVDAFSVGQLALSIVAIILALAVVIGPDEDD